MTASTPAELGTELGHKEECQAGTEGGEHLPVVEGGQLAVLDQVVPEAGEAVPGEHLERRRREQKVHVVEEIWDGRRASKDLGGQWVKRMLLELTMPGSSPTHLASSLGWALRTMLACTTLSTFGFSFFLSVSVTGITAEEPY